MIDTISVAVNRRAYTDLSTTGNIALGSRHYGAIQREHFKNDRIGGFVTAAVSDKFLSATPGRSTLGGGFVGYRLAG